MSRSNGSEPYLTTGTRLTVRLRLPSEDVAPGGPRLTDVVGEVVRVTPDRIEMSTRRGAVTVPRDRIVAVKVLPPAPVRRGPAHTAIGVDDLERVMADGMPPLRSHRVGEWLLRWASGYTGRANSTLPLGDPGVPLDAAVRQVQRWYRGYAPTLFQLFGPSGFDPTSTALGTLLAKNDWSFFQHTLVMTASAAQVAVSADRPGDGAVRIEVRAEPDAEWWAAASPRSKQHQQTVQAMLALIPSGSYLTACSDQAPAGHARTVHGQGWCGIFDVHTDPSLRRRGVARALMAAVASDAQRHGERSLYLQVSADNTAAIALYESLGFVRHHDYWYSRAPRHPRQV